MRLVYSSGPQFMPLIARIVRVPRRKIARYLTGLRTPDDMKPGYWNLGPRACSCWMCDPHKLEPNKTRRAREKREFRDSEKRGSFSE